MAVSIAEYETTEWTTPIIPPDLPADLIERARQVRRRHVAAGEGGFHASHVQMPAGQEVVPHHHDHSELIVVIEGSLRFDGGDGPVDLGPLDAIVIEAGQVYGFTVGDAGVHFLLVRGGRATSSLVDSPTER